LSRKSPRFVVAAVIVLGLSLAAPGLANASTKRCITADVSASVLLPDGTEHPAGQWTVCVTQHLSPVASLHHVKLDNRPVGMHASRRGVAEGPAESPYLMFSRIDGGKLQLSGFAVPSGSRMETMETYVMVPEPTVTADWSVIAQALNAVDIERVPAGAE
jgi:hypothetical protein